MTSFKVLTIDGGGIKGLYSATILGLIESELRKENGDETRIIDFFDLVCGTSTGGLIALGLSLRIPATDICTFYEQKGPRIFKKIGRAHEFVRQVLLGGKFSDVVLRAALEELLGRRTIADSQCLLCIPTYDFTHGTYEVFRRDHKEGRLVRHNRLPMVDVALATSAAPTFFPLAQIPLEHDTQYVDGGVWANNPSLVGLAEAIQYFCGPGKSYDHLMLLSVASLNYGAGKAPLLRRRRGFVKWAPDLFDMSLIAQSEFADLFLQMMQRSALLPLAYTRIPSARIDAQQTRYLQLDSATPRSIALIKQLATDMYYQCRGNNTMATFLSQRKTYNIDG